MIYSQCKCGETKHWGSGMDPAPCTPCRKCGSVPAGGPSQHRDPVPHDFQAQPVETDDGPRALSRCRHCMKTRAQIAKEATAAAAKGEP